MADKVIDFGFTEDTSKNIIKVIGVGGGGCNAVKNMYSEGIVNVSFAVCNTDSQSLSKSPVPVKVMLGKSGLGAGADPERGRLEAQSTEKEIKELLDDGTKMVFVTAGMGGGTGTGAAPIIAGVAKSMGILTVGIVTLPFYFEKRNKIVMALKGVEEMRKNVDALLIINNERLCDVYSDSDISVRQAFGLADKVLSDATKSISELITIEGVVNVDFRDVEATIHAGGGAVMAMGRASGPQRVQDAIFDALDSPLLYGSDITKAHRILFNIYTSSMHPMFVKEMQAVNAFFDELDPNIQVIWGMSEDDSLNEDAKVIILATGLDNEFAPTSLDDVHPTVDEQYYEGIIDKLYHPIRDRFGSKPQPQKPQPVAQQETVTGGEDSSEISADKDDSTETANIGESNIEEVPANVPSSKTLGQRLRAKLLQIAQDLDFIEAEE